MAKRAPNTIPLSILADIKKIIKKMKPKPDDPKSKTPCSQCMGRDFGCSIMQERQPKKECRCFADKRVGIVVEYADGSKAVIGKKND